MKSRAILVEDVPSLSLEKATANQMRTHVVARLKIEFPLQGKRMNDIFLKFFHNMRLIFGGLTQNK